MEIQVSKKMIQENTNIYTPALLLYAFLEQNCKRTMAGYIVNRPDLTAARKAFRWDKDRMEQCCMALRRADFLEKTTDKFELLRPWKSANRAFKNSELAYRFKAYGLEPVVSEDGIVSVVSKRHASPAAITPYLTLETDLHDGDRTGFEALTLAYLKDAISSNPVTDEYKNTYAVVDTRIFPLLFGSWCESIDLTCCRISMQELVSYRQAGPYPYDKMFSLVSFHGPEISPYTNPDREVEISIPVSQVQYIRSLFELLPTFEEYNTAAYGTDYMHVKETLYMALEKAAKEDEAEAEN